MDYLPKESYKRILVISFYFIVGGIALFVFFKYLLKLFLPFIIAWGVSLIIRPLSKTLHVRTKIPQKLISIILVLIIIVFLGLVLFLLFDKLIFELRGIVVYITEHAETWINGIIKYINKLSDRFPFLQSFASEDELKKVFSDIFQSIIARFTQNVPNMLRGIITLLPNLLFVSLILIMASYYFSADYDDIKKYILLNTPQKIKTRFSGVGEKLKRAGINIAKGYLLTMTLTFLQLYVGFLILRTEYAFSVALIIALVDILPVIGVGTVLIPWAAVKIFAGSYYQGFGLLIIFAVVSVVKEVLEPKIIGKSIGLHPLATLFSMYIGLELCGFLGLIFFPVFVIAFKNIFEKAK
ncbi:MAG: sporulation integral membrane protein YtvI [Clostridia bacterium]|nr:sporulation integral membrane protein YtvI [Clostridia bacterium]